MKHLITHAACVLWVVALFGQSDIEQAEYFIDDDPGVGNGINIPIDNGDLIEDAFFAEVSGLEPGMHSIKVRFMDTDGEWSLYSRDLFYVKNVIDHTIEELEYFLGDDPGVGNGTSVPVSAALEVEDEFSTTINLDPGMESIKFRVKNGSESWGLYARDLFFAKSPVDHNIVASEYFLGTDPGVGNATAVDLDAGLEVEDAFEFEANGLEEVNQFVQVRFQNASGQWSLYGRNLFRPTNLSSPNTLEALEYFFDEDPGVGMATSYSISSAFELDETLEIEVPEELIDGEHWLYVRVKNSGEDWSLYARDSLEVGNFDNILELNAQFDIYPNPVVDELSIRSSGEPVERVRVLNSAGRLVYDGLPSDLTVDFRGLARGHYLVQIFTAENAVSRKIIK